MTSQPPVEEPSFTSADDALSGYQIGDAGLLPDDAELTSPLADFDPPGDDIEADARAELEHLDDALADEGFRSRLAKESERLNLVISTNYWFCVSFGTEPQMQAFLDAMGWQQGRYLDGREIAATQGIELPDDPVWPSVRPAGTLARRAHTVDENRDLGN